MSACALPELFDDSANRLDIYQISSSLGIEWLDPLISFVGIGKACA